MISIIAGLLAYGITDVIKNTRALEKALNQNAEKTKATEPLHTILARFTLEGHQYLSIRTNHSFGDTILHDPDCPCPSSQRTR